MRGQEKAISLALIYTTQTDERRDCSRSAFNNKRTLHDESSARFSCPLTPIIGHQVGSMDAATQKELVRHENGGEVALPTELVESAREYARAAYAKRTQDAYARAWKSFEAWCAALHEQALPADPEKVAVWLTALAKGDGARKPLARSSINQALSAVIMRHRDAGYAFDRKHAAIARVWKGISNTKAREQTVRKAKPLLTDDLRALIDGLDQLSALEAGDAALLTLGWAAAIRRSELVSLDWQKLGGGGGFVCIDERHRRHVDGIEGLARQSRGNRRAA